MKTTDLRLPDMLAMRQRGQTLQVIGTKYGLTRERVRQLLAQTTAPDGAGVYAIRAAKRAAVLDTSRSAVVTYLNVNPGAAPDEVAAATGLGAGEVRALARSGGANGLLREAVTAEVDRPYRYAEQDILGALRAAAATLPSGEQLTVKKYDALRLGGFAGPSVPLVSNRFGTWVSACARAGVTPGKPIRSYETGFDDDAMLGGLVRFLTVSTSISVVTYDAWRHTQGVPLASSSLIRKRYGSWITARGLAQDRMAHSSGTIRNTAAEQGHGPDLLAA